MSIDVKKAKLELQARLAQLLQRLKGIELTLETPASADWEDWSAEREDDQMLEGLGLAGQEEIRKIRAALTRIAAGQYGTCTRCGQAIPGERLALLPETPFCASCAMEHR